MNEAAAIAALIALGLSPQLSAAMVAHWTAEKLARRVDAFGVLLPRAQAILLHEKVAALKEQYLKKQLPNAAARAALKSYEIPDVNAQALLSAWDAQTYKQVIQP